MFFKKRKRRTDSAVAPANAEQPQVVPQEVEQLNFKKPTRKEVPKPQPVVSNDDSEALEPTISDQELAEFMNSSNQELKSEADEFVKHMVNSGNDRALIHRVLDSSRFGYEREKAFQGLLEMMKNPFSGERCRL